VIRRADEQASAARRRMWDARDEGKFSRWALVARIFWDLARRRREQANGK